MKLLTCLFLLLSLHVSAQGEANDKKETSYDYFMKAHDCDFEVMKFGAKKHNAEQEYQDEIYDLKRGLFCSRCNQSKTAIEKGGENFNQHLQRVQGTVVQAPKEAYEQAMQRYSDKLNSIKSEEDNKRKECESLQKQAKEMQENEMEELRKKLHTLKGAEIAQEKERIFNDLQKKQEEWRNKRQQEKEKKEAEEKKKQKDMETLIKSLDEMMPHIDLKEADDETNKKEINWDEPEEKSEISVDWLAPVTKFPENMVKIKNNIVSTFKTLNEYRKQAWTDEDLENRYKILAEEIRIPLLGIPVNAWEAQDDVLEYTLKNKSISKFISNNIDFIKNRVFRKNGEYTDIISNSLASGNLDALENMVNDYDLDYSRQNYYYSISPIRNLRDDMKDKLIGEKKDYFKLSIEKYTERLKKYMPFLFDTDK